jgi:hypothetical protein
MEPELCEFPDLIRHIQNDTSIAFHEFFEASNSQSF